jgi:anti-sigma regulatory factor (Ser/Thr protein kinase)
MPEMNGLELVSAVKDDYPHIPVILMTAQGSEEIAAEALRCGAASYVPKLRLADDLIATLNQVHDAAQSEQAQSYLMHYMTAADAEFELPNDSTIIRACLKHLLNMLRCLPLGDVTERMRVGIALQEALNNAYYHGNLEVVSEAGHNSRRFEKVAASRIYEEPYIHRRIHVRAEISRQQAVFTIRDDGTGFDVASLSANDTSAVSSTVRRRGITLMQSIMDEVTFNETGNEVRLVKNAVQEEEFFDEEDE